MNQFISKDTEILKMHDKFEEIHVSQKNSTDKTLDFKKFKLETRAWH